MYPEQFQGEPIKCNVFETINRKQMGVAKPAAVASLLLGLSQRDRIADTEKEMLDNLAPADSIVFLIQGNRYIHPENVELFPLELIETTLSQHGTPLFSHRYQPSQENSGHMYEIQTALIDRKQSKSLILGFLRPEHDLVQQTGEDWFCNLAALFRDVSASLNDLNKQITEVLADNTPALVVNRSSGRILCMNSYATDIIGMEEHELLDLEFGQVKERLSKALEGRKLVIRNICKAELSLSIITLPTAVAKAESGDSFAGDFLAHRFRHKISNIMIAAGLLESMAGGNPGEDESTMIQTIIDETQKMDNDLTKLNLLMNYDNLTVTSVSLVYELEKAADLLDSTPGQAYTIDIQDHADNPIITGSGAAPTCLFESILMAHMAYRPGSRTIATFDRDSTDNTVSVRLETTQPSTYGETCMDSFWGDYALHLGSRMGVSDLCSHQIEGSVIRTDFSIETDKPRVRH